MEITENKALLKLNTFGIEASARYYTKFRAHEDISQVLKQFPDLPKLILGGGSNVLFTKDFNGLVLHNGMKGRRILKEDKQNVWLKVAGGESWHETVMFAVEQGFGGIENMALIPGSAGAAPMQNIGAYGVEIKDVFEELEAYEIAIGKVHRFTASDCRFGYRESFFKKEGKNKFIITSVTLKLTKAPFHKLKLHYSGIQEALEEKKVTEPNIQTIAEAVITVRSRKLPDPKKIGNSGSFFKNPIISKVHLESLKSHYPEIVFYPVDEEQVKVPAGWLIDRCGWKGKVIGNTGTYKNQALVLVNHGGAKGEEVLRLAQDIKRSVKSNFEIDLFEEVNIVL